MGIPQSNEARWLLLAGILASQFLVDAVVSWLRGHLGYGMELSEVLTMLRWSFSVDVLLSTSGLMVATNLGDRPRVFLAVLFPIALMAFLATDRRRQIDRLVQLHNAFTDAHSTARQDALTGLGNRLAWEEALSEARRTERTRVAVVLLDVDYLKKVNDQHGHAAGDELLCTVSDLLIELSPPGSVACRLGGDEFGVLLSGAMASAHHSVAQSFTQAFEAAPLIRGIPVSASVGSAGGRAGHLGRIVSEADELLYAAKRSRPDRVEWSEDHSNGPFRPSTSVTESGSFTT